MVGSHPLFRFQLLSNETLVWGEEGEKRKVRGDRCQQHLGSWAKHRAGLRVRRSAFWSPCHCNDGCKPALLLECSSLPGDFLVVSRPLSVTLESLSAELGTFLFAPQQPVHPQLQQLPYLIMIIPGQCHKVERTRRTDYLGFPIQAFPLTICDPGEVSVAL